MHWAYGTGWGSVHGVLRSLGLPPAAAAGGHFGAVWGGALVTLPALGVAPPVTEWGRTEIAIDVFHHAVYAAATALAYAALDR